MPVEPLSPTPLHPVRRAVFAQHWRDLTMLHWAVDPAVVAPLLPRGTEPDLLDGRTYVGLVPFVMAGVRVPWTPPLRPFPEVNVRLYVVDADGRRGVVFRSLEASRLLPVVTARVGYHLPYHWARMTVRHGPSTVSYETSRRGPGRRGAGGLVRVRIGPPVVPDELTTFLTARWGLYSDWYGGRTAWAPVEHPPWQVHAATLLTLSDTLCADAGLPVTGAAGPRHVVAGRAGAVRPASRAGVAGPPRGNAPRVIFAFFSARLRQWLVLAVVVPLVGRLLQLVGVRLGGRNPRVGKALTSTGGRLRGASTRRGAAAGRSRPSSR